MPIRPHLTRECGRLSGLTPAALASQRAAQVKDLRAGVDARDEPPESQHPLQRLRPVADHGHGQRRRNWRRLSPTSSATSSAPRWPGSRSRRAARATAGSGPPPASRTAVTSSIWAAATSGSSVAVSCLACAGRRSARSARWSRSSLSGIPSAGPPAEGRKRTPRTTVPAAIVVATGPVSGPATKAPRPCSQTRSVHPSGSTSPARSALESVDLRPQAGDGVPQRGGRRPFGIAGRQGSDIHPTGCHADGRFVQYRRGGP